MNPALEHPSSGFPPQARAALVEASELLQGGGRRAAGLSAHILAAVRDGAGTPEGHVGGIAEHIAATAPSHHATSRRLSAQPGNFYGAAAGSIELAATDATGDLVIVDGAPVFGHWDKEVIVTPRNGRQWLTIPACKESYGRSAADFGDRLQFQPRGPGLAVLVLREQGAPKVEQAATPKKAAKARKARPAPDAARSAEKILYWLVKRVVLPADPTLLPTKTDFLKLAAAGAANAMRQAFGHPGAPAA